MAAYSIWAPGAKIKDPISQNDPGVAEQQYIKLQNAGVYNQGRAEQSRSNWAGDGGAGARTNAGGYADAAFGKRVGSNNTAGQSFWNGVAGTYANNGPGYVSEAHASFAPNVDPNLSGYYDSAFKQGSAQINKQLAARGQFGSSAGMGQITQLATNLGAERANREADYGLRRQQALTESALAASGDERNWVSTMGDLAFGAGREDLAYRDFGLNASNLQQQMELGARAQDFNENMSLDQFQLAQAGAAMDGAQGAQGARDARLQAYFQNVLGAGNAISGAYSPMLAFDADAAQTSAGMTMGQGTDNFNIAYNNTTANQQQYMQALQQLMSMGGNQFAFGGR